MTDKQSSTLQYLLPDVGPRKVSSLAVCAIVLAVLSAPCVVQRIVPLRVIGWLPWELRERAALYGPPLVAAFVACAAIAHVTMSRRRGRGMAVTALALAILWIVLLLFLRLVLGDLRLGPGD